MAAEQDYFTNLNQKTGKLETIITITTACPKCCERICFICPPKIVDYEKFAKYWEERWKTAMQENKALRQEIRALIERR